MAAMEGMSGADASTTAFWGSVRMHLDSVIRLEPNRLVFVRAAHDSLAHRSLERMDREMRAMNMPAGATWGALADSVRGDLAALDRLAGEAFVLRMRAHAGRLRRLIAMHERMTASTDGPTVGERIPDSQTREWRPVSRKSRAGASGGPDLRRQGDEP